MTKARRGPSLIQARSPPGNKNHNHFHSLQRRSINTNPHINSNNDGSEPHHQHHQHHNRQAPDAAPTPAADSALVTHVVQTVSVIQIVDGNGVPVRVQTQFAEPATVVVDPVAGVTVDYSVYQAAGGIPTAQPEPPATPAPGEVQPGSAPKPAAEPAVDPAPVPQTDSLPYPETNPPPETVPLESSSVLTPAIPSDETVPPTFPPAPMSSEVPLESQDQLPTSAPLTTPPLAFPTLSAGSNSTIPGSKSIQQSRYGNNNSSSLHLLAESGSASSSPYSFLSNSDASSSSLPTTTTSYYITTSSLASSTGASLSGFSSTASGASGAGGVGGSTPSATATADQDADEAPVETGMVVGSVVGSIAGAALIVFLVLFALKMRKRQQGRVMLGDGNSTNTRGMLTGPNGPPGGNSGASAMVQRSLGLGSAALAGLGAKRASRQASEQPEEAGERGFYRVSGRKLPPVLQAGGDGYTDPRMSVVSNDESVYYRQSTTFFDDPASGSTAPRLALGSPMRPVSGVPIMRSGPARTPVQESNPFADPAPPSHLMVPPLRDAVGRSLTSQDGSRGSVSRFTEEIR